MRRFLLGFVIVAVIVGLAVPLTSCAGKTPATVAATVAYNGEIITTAVDSVQRFIVAEEAAGRIPRNEAVTAMEAIGRSLDAARQVPPYLRKLALLPTGAAEGAPVIDQIQNLLAIAASEAASVLIPIGNEATRKQVVALILEVNKAISILNKQILGVGGTL